MILHQIINHVKGFVAFLFGAMRDGALVTITGFAVGCYLITVLIVVKLLINLASEVQP